MAWVYMSGGYCAVVALLSTGNLFRAARLEQRIGVLRNGLICLGPGLIALAIALVTTAQAPSPALESIGDGPATKEWLEAARAARQALLMAVGGLAFALAMLGVQAIVVLRDLRDFVTTHRLDLAGRDQAAMTKTD